MKITTKFRLLDNVYFMCDNKICYSQIKSVYAEIDMSRQTEVKYSLNSVLAPSTLINEDKVFATKEGLINSLELTIKTS